MKNILSLKICFASIILMLSSSLMAQKVGIGTLTPTHGFHIVPKANIEPLRIDSLRSYQMGDNSILITDATTGVVRHILMNQLDSIFDMNDVQSMIDTAYLNNHVLSIIENGDTNFIDFASIAKDSIFIDSLLSSPYFNNQVYANVADSLLKDQAWIDAMRDSLETDVDSVVVNNGTLTIYEGGNSVNVNIHQIGNDSAFIDSLLSSDYFNDSIYSNISNNLLTDSDWINAMRDSLETDVDSVIVNNGFLTIYEGGNSVNVNIHQIGNDSSFIDSLLSSNYFNDSIYNNISNNQLNDSAWLQAVKVSIETNVDSIYQDGYTINIIEGNDTIVGMLDSSEWFSDADDDIYARRAYNNGNKVVVTDQGKLGIGLDDPIGIIHIQQDANSNETSDIVLVRATDLPNNDMDIDFYRTRGTLTIPQAVQAGDKCGGIRFNGFDGDGVYTLGQISGEIDTAAGPTSLPFALKFYTSQFGTVTDLERMVINGFGNIGIGVSAPRNRLHVTDSIDPLRLSGLVEMTNADTIASVTTSGVIKKTSSSAIRSHASFVSVSGAYPILITDEVVLIDASASAYIVTLPDATADAGKVITLKLTDATNTITVNSGGGNIDGVASTSLNGATDKAKFLSDGTNWWIID